MSASYSMLHRCTQDLRACSSTEKAAFFPNFFKTGKGQYGEGDIFIGVPVPDLRRVTRMYRDMTLPDIAKLLHDPIHEYRLAGLFLLVSRYERGDAIEKKTVAKFYLAHLSAVNNWDLVDSSASQILGAFLFTKNDTTLLEKFARSSDLWKQRIAIVATQYFIRHGKHDPTLQIAKILLHHPHDLIHKAVGWMLREMGKKDVRLLKNFLHKHAADMPRTMLRYAIEKFSNEERKRYLRM